MEQAAGRRGVLVRDYKEGAVMGITDLLSKAGMLLRNIGVCKSDIRNWKPDVVILIDYPGFNMKIALPAKAGTASSRPGLTNFSLSSRSRFLTSSPGGFHLCIRETRFWMQWTIPRR